MIGSARYEGELRKRVEQEITLLRDALEAGVAIKDYAQYQNYVGRLTALKAVIGTYSDEVHEKLNKE